ncbi:MAG: cupin domain-containing protein [Ferruginibacter sp.]
MHRKNFLASALLAAPAFALGKNIVPDFSNGNPTAFVVGAGKSRFGETVKFLGVHPNDLKISGKDTDGQLSVFEYTGFAKTGPMLHIHFNQDEIFMITEGSYRFVVGSQTYILSTGDSIFLPRNIPHTWIQLTDKGKMIYMLQPAGKMEEFFSYMNKLTTPPPPEEMERIHTLHEMKVVGPPLEL